MKGHLDILLTADVSSPIAELVQAISAELVALGVETRTVRDVRTANRGNPVLVVAPHEVFANRTPDDDLLTTLGSALLLVVAHPSSEEWRQTLAFANHAAALLHISDAGVAAFKRHGHRVRRFPLGYHPSMGTWKGDDSSPRDVDVTFIGRLTERRSHILAAAARSLSLLDVEIHLPRRLPVGGRSVLDYLGGSQRDQLLARSRTSLDIAAEPDPAFGWLRALQAVCNGAVLVTEPSPDYAPLRAGEHFIEVPAGASHEALAAVLGDDDSLSRIRQAAYRFLLDELPLSRSVEQLADAAEAVAQAGFRRKTRATPRPAEAVRATTDEPSAELRRLDELHELVTKQSAVLKKLFLDQRLLRRQVARLSQGLTDPTRPLVELTRTPAAEADDPPEVTIIITLHNYGRFVSDALDSSIATEGVSIELIVVDDASTDNSTEVVKDFMSRHPDARVTLIEQRLNTGVQRARNHAFTLTRAPFAFVLDADNVVYPHGIAKLRDALLADGAAGYAYGLIERFGANGPIDLMNTGSWDAALLAQEHYIDAMALIRVDGWKQVGGYVTEQSLELGWEDYDLWLSFAMAGMHGAYVREIVGRYRIHDVSSLTTTTLDTASLQAKLRERHAPFFTAIESAS